MLQINPYIYPGLNLTDHKKATTDIIISAVEKATGVTFQDIISLNRKREIKDARHLLNYFLRKKTSKSLTDIGEIIKRNHATVIHSVNLVDDTKEIDLYFKKNIEKINYYLYFT